MSLWEIMTGKKNLISQDDLFKARFHYIWKYYYFVHSQPYLPPLQTERPCFREEKAFQSRFKLILVCCYHEYDGYYVTSFWLSIWWENFLKTMKWRTQRQFISEKKTVAFLFLLGIKENSNLDEVYHQTCFKVYLIPLGSVITHMW